jgi:hypothetical protein
MMMGFGILGFTLFLLVLLALLVGGVLLAIWLAGGGHTAGGRAGAESPVPAADETPQRGGQR